MDIKTELGTCYEDAWRFLIREEEGELIHGSVQTIGKRINHAWVELPSFVWEPKSGESVRKDYFYEIAEPQEQARYTAEEAAIMAARTGNLGPWSDEERRQFLKRSGNPGFTAKEAKSIGEKLGIDFKSYDVDQFRQGLNVELEHCNVTNCAPLLTGKIAQAHLNELPDYYTRLAKMEEKSRMKEAISKEEAIGMLERLSATPQEAARLLVSDEEERRAIWRGIQERVKKEQNKFAPFYPREGPPLPRIFAGLRWPWKK